MEEYEIYLVYGAVIMVIAVMAIAIDWFGKPIKRRFVPKMYRYPDERRPRAQAAPRTPWSDAAFVLPLGPEMAHQLEDQQRRLAAVRAAKERMALRHQELQQQRAVEGLLPGDLLAPVVLQPEIVDAGTSPEPVSALLERSGAEVAAPPAPQTSVVARDTGWQVGDYIYNFTIDGREPSAATIRARYWRNVASADSALRIFGAGNLERMVGGKPPRRRNPRSGRVEMMVLPTATFADSGGEAPTPYWPGAEIDPFAEA